MSSKLYRQFNCLWKEKIQQQTFYCWISNWARINFSSEAWQTSIEFCHLEENDFHHRTTLNLIKWTTLLFSQGNSRSTFALTIHSRYRQRHVVNQDVSLLSMLSLRQFLKWHSIFHYSDLNNCLVYFGKLSRRKIWHFYCKNNLLETH